MRILRNHNLLPRAKELRKNMTPQERKLWYLFLRTYPVRIYRQRILGSFIADFYCAAARLVIEIDGSQHATPSGAAHDADRARILRNNDLAILRFTNHEIDRHFQAVCQTIDRAVQSRL